MCEQIRFLHTSHRLVDALGKVQRSVAGEQDQRGIALGEIAAHL